MAYKVSVTSNIDSDSLTQAKKHAGTSHGMSMLALALLDANHRGLELTLVFDDVATLENCAEQMTAVWDRCMSNKVLFRSAKKNGSFLTDFFDKPMTDVNTMPTSSAEYKNHKLILDVELNDTDTDTGGSHVYKFYRWLDQQPRVMTLKCIDNSQKNEI